MNKDMGLVRDSKVVNNNIGKINLEDKIMSDTKGIIKNFGKKEKKLKVKELKQIKDICEGVIALQEKMKNSFFWTPPMRADDRRSYERKYSQEYEFTFRVENMNLNSVQNVHVNISIMIVAFLWITK